MFMPNFQSHVCLARIDIVNKGANVFSIEVKVIGYKGAGDCIKIDAEWIAYLVDIAFQS